MPGGGYMCGSEGWEWNVSWYPPACGMMADRRTLGCRCGDGSESVRNDLISGSGVGLERLFYVEWESDVGRRRPRCENMESNPSLRTA